MLSSRSVLSQSFSGKIRHCSVKRDGGTRYRCDCSDAKGNIVNDINHTVLVPNLTVRIIAHIFLHKRVARERHALSEDGAVDAAVNGNAAERFVFLVLKHRIHGREVRFHYGVAVQAEL